MRVRPMESESSHSGYRPKVRHRASQREVISKERKALPSFAFHNTDKFGWYRCLADAQNVVDATKPKTSADWQAPQKSSKGPLNSLACSCRLCCHQCHRNFEGKGYVVPYAGEMGAWRTATGEGEERDTVGSALTTKPFPEYRLLGHGVLAVCKHVPICAGFPISYIYPKPERHLPASSTSLSVKYVLNRSSVDQH